MLEYLLKSAVCMGILLLFYKVFLEKERMHVFKRFYLLTSLIAALLIPSLVIKEYVQPIDLVLGQVSSSSEIVTPLAVNAPSDRNAIDFELLLAMFYGVGLLIFAVRFFKHLFEITIRIRKNPKVIEKFNVKVLLSERMPPHTFFRYIFLPREKYKIGAIPEEVLYHEETHVKQRHSYDVVFVELLQIIFWFNPLVHLYKKSIKLNHEFLADEAVLKRDANTKAYQNTLLSYLSEASERKYHLVYMANAINYSSIKKRFVIMKAHTSKKSKIIKSALVLPLITLLLFGFGKTKTVQVPSSDQEVTRQHKKVGEASVQELSHFNTLAKKYNLVPIETRVIPLDDLRILETIYGRMTTAQKAKAQPFPECLPKNQQSATRAEMAEYNKLAKKYNAMPRDNMRILKKEIDRLTHIYKIMSDKQRADAEPFPNLPEPPEPPEPPEVSEVSETPPSPPEPKTPVEHIKEVAKKGAVFYFENKKISAQEAIELLEKNEGLSLVTNHTDETDYVVNISKGPILIKK